MTPSSPPSAASRRTRNSLISDLRSDLERSRTEHFQSSPSRFDRSPILDKVLEVTESSFAPSKDEALVSTQQIEYDNTTDRLPQIRTTARARRFGVPRPEQQAVDTSMVEQEFHDFDQGMDESSASMSIELGRGAKHTPSKLHQVSSLSPNVFLSLGGDDSLYDVSGTPGSLPRLPGRKSDGVERGSLRRDAQVRRAASAPHKDFETGSARTTKAANRQSPAKPSTAERRRTLAEMHAKVTSEAESSLLDEHPPTVTISAKNTRFGNPRSRQSSGANVSVPTKFTSGRGLDVDGRNASTPQRTPGGNQRAAPTPGNMTANSFALPDLPNLTELVSGVYRDGTPVFSRTTPARSRFGPPGKKRSYGEDPKKFYLVGDIPLPSEEKAIIASLKLLQEKVDQLEQEKAEAEHKIGQYEIEVAQLHAELETRDNFRRSDSALGSDGEDPKERQNLRIEKTRLESSVQSLQNRLDRTERKVSISEIATKRITQERDNVVTQLGVAFMEQEELKADNDALRAENETLRGEVDSLRAENEDLQNQLSDANNHLQEETQRWETEKVEIRQRAGKSDQAVLAENEQLRKDLRRSKAQYEEDTQRFTLEKSQLRKQAKKEAKAEYEKLRTENEQLYAEIEDARARQEEEIRRWKAQEAELRGNIERRDDTIRQFQDMPQDEANQELRQENENLRNELARFQKKTQRDQQKIRDMADVTEKLMEMRQEDLIRDRAQEQAEVASARTRSQLPGRRHVSEEYTRSKPSRKSLESQGEVRKTRSTRRVITTDVEDRQQPGPSTVRSRSQQRRQATQDQPQHTARSSTHDFATERHRMDDFSEAESTTDIDLSRRQQDLQEEITVPKTRSKSRGPKFVEPPAMADTYLSLMDSTELKEIRRQVEMEYRMRHERPIGVETRQDTVNAQVSATTGSTKAPKKSSLKQIVRSGRAEEIYADDDEDKENQYNDVSELTNGVSGAHKEDTKQSLLSNTSRRRRSAPIEMTSAFIIPDITPRKSVLQPSTINESHTVMCDISSHDAKNCTICDRVMSGSAESNVKIPTPVRPSERPEVVDDVDATMRPSQPPKDALAMVIKQLKDEIDHILLELTAEKAKLDVHDPALGRRKRKAIEARIMELTELYSIKSDQLYALHDVLEGQKEQYGDDGHEITEIELNDTLRSIGIEPAATRSTKTKRVMIEDESDDDISESELPWEGITDTESIVSRSSRRRSRLF